MRGFNKVIVAGNLTRDPELRYTVNKRAVLRFGIAVNSTWKNSNGETQESVEYVNITAWGPMGETMSKYLKKGSPVLVEGKLRTTTYDKDGIKKYMTEVNADNILLLGSRQDSESGAGRRSNAGYSSMSGGDFKSINEEGFGDISFGDDFSQGISDIGNSDNSSDSDEIPF